MTEQAVVTVIHENPEWFPPLKAAFDAAGIPVREWLLEDGAIDLASAPPPGVYWSRLSASAHTRDHGYAKEYGRAILTWLEAAGRRVVNGRPVLEIEVSKVAQYTALAAAGFDVPHTIAVFGRHNLSESAREFTLPFISKHNQGGKGLGVRRFDSYEEFDAYAAGDDFEASPDNITLLQEYVAAREPFITRVEFAGGEYVYAVRVDISGGSFELCPAEACIVPAAALPDPFCLIDGSTDGNTSLFTLREGFDSHPIIARYRDFLAGIGAEVAGIEFIETADGRLVTYDINTNTNYNPTVDASAPRSGPRQIARFLGDLLELDQGVNDQLTTRSTK